MRRGVAEGSGRRHHRRKGMSTLLSTTTKFHASGGCQHTQHRLRPPKQRGLAATHGLADSCALALTAALNCGAGNPAPIPPHHRCGSEQCCVGRGQGIGPTPFSHMHACMYIRTCYLYIFFIYTCTIVDAQCTSSLCLCGKIGGEGTY